MHRWRGYEAAPRGWGRSVVTIGVFDGVHMGHQATIGHAVERAKGLGLPSLVLTFDPHPSEVVRPGSHPAVLTGQLRKAELIEQLGVHVLCVQPFTLDFSRLSAEQFVHDMLVEHMHAALVVVGENFRFGHKAAGDVELLTKLGRTFGFAVEPSPLVTADGVIFSSTYVRACVDAGDVTAAAQVLGRPHRVEGVVVRGDQRGRTLGFPTANLMTARFTAIPGDGIYAAWLVRGAERLPAAVSIGTNPTFSGQERRLEGYILDFDGDLYGERLAFDFVAHLRPQLKFTDVDDLVRAIEDDVERTRAVLGVSASS
ncbi:riboflavin biosynthesis protein [Rhizocola hellebori]|uniref:Riboflavin biosynthesis protein n=1 Tax=Rhizocola hellebori TaxID=1392758 RepID=A0A8J3QAE9_9ACTN|nr:bifunctional riboflavin kinase/FAD synthetase [Rhizocola hellebori]GIH05990.1 riboflavin biosynthesis protein [Rhizocola hellebori]